MELLLLALAVGAAYLAVRFYLRKQRYEYLMNKYGDEATVAAIMKRTIWEGMSEEQLIDSWGPPAAREQKVYKTKITETFKYNQQGKNRFASRVRVENGLVVGWQQR
jgi:hypothetical protein